MVIMSFIRKIVPERSFIRLSWHYAKAFVAAAINGFSARKLTVVAITGTDGKTTTVGMIHHILMSSGRRVGSASTAFVQVMNEKEENETHLTSLSPFVLQKFLKRLVKEKCEYAVIEASSHGLVQGRLNYAYPSVSGVTNVTSEHLDYHKSIEQYRKDKGKLFEMLKGRGVKVLNGGDKSMKKYLNIESEETVVYSLRSPRPSPELVEGRVERGPLDVRCERTLEESYDFWLSDISANEFTTSAKIHRGEEVFDLELNIPGIFNLENALCAISCASSVGIPINECIESLENFKSLPGRMERIDEGQKFNAFVDFAVSSNSYRKTLETLQKIVGENGRVMVLCSSCGNRMKEKRPEIGKIASECADVVVVTEDETYGEDPMKVLEEVWSGINQSITEAHKIEDRKEGIRFLVKNAREGDAIVFCGMGPFSTMNKLEGSIEWDERKVVREIISEEISNEH
ncbi:UDP-N-acetylmuramyl-tripeptide synthetase [Candidatus Peribacteria bacterium]|jgi:UDP-N-acetylmuramoyl-L-alanyl-D-glutamate--2,6-diaminopimelate ligase|nr:UDP-N-acetylmuramyl-tripeptide synthetase [Candidatus Peribacteria bacterium]MBT4021295.1 UDP-N-acetylmuramyl-tripeptide synthetase [Candidatus Peribacteria bacterium]MBT4241244.1 UDP-N-acetylmuramyl-tripeptide synthetase [Candidatus Peribacteria bacterium]MBT4474269.1 UDP-N-acetylmuramyl-tripeptide synthetase [Candidatus Peribacteria bacterium]